MNQFLLFKNRTILFLLLVLLFSNAVNAATITSTATGGSWATASTWSAVSRTGTITTTSGSKTVTGVGTSFTTELAVGSVIQTTGGVTIGTVSSITNNTKLLLVANAASTNTGIAYIAQVIPSATDNVIIATTGTGSVTLGAAATAVDITVNAGSKLNIGAINALNINGVFTNNGTTTGTSGRLISSGAINNTGIITLTSGRLTSSGAINNSGTITLTTGRLTSSGAINNSGTITLTTGRIDNSGGTADFTNTGTITGSDVAGTIRIGGNFINTGTNSLGSAEVRFYGGIDQSIGSFTTTGLVSMLKTGGTATFMGNVNMNGLTINGSGGTLNLGVGLIHTTTNVVTLTTGSLGILNGGSSTLNVNVISTTAINGTGSLFAAGTGTINLSATGNQTVSASSSAVAPLTFNNLTFSSSGVKSVPSTSIVNGILSMEGSATASAGASIPVYGINATLQYNTPANRVVGLEWITPFAATGGVIIANTGIITMNAAKVFNASVPLTINNGARLTTASFGLTFGGNFINNGGTFTAGSSPIVITNTMVTQSIAGFTTTGLVSMTKTAGIATFAGIANGAGLTINGPGGTLDLGAGLIHTFTGAWTRTVGTLVGNSSTLNIGGTVTNTAGTFTAGTSTVNYNGTTQTIANVAYYNLILSGSLAKTTTGATVTNILSMEGAATATAAPVYGTSATLQYNTATARISGPEWITPFVAAGGIIIANTGAIAANAIKSFTNVPLTINSGATFDNGGFAISGGSILSVASAGTLIVSGSSAFPTFTTTTLDANSSVNYSGSAQAVATKNYGNLTLSGSGNKTFAGATTIAGILYVNGSAVAILPSSTTSTSTSLIFTGPAQTPGSWGGTASGATYKDAVHFGSGTNGVLNVNTSCVAGTWLGNHSTDWNTAGNWCGGIIPTATSDITIPITSFQPVIGAAGGVCRNITISSGATLTITGSNTLTVSGNWSNNGTFTANTSTVNFNGTVAQTIGGTASATYANLTNSNITNTLTVQSWLTINNVLSIPNAASVLDMTTFALTGGGSFSNSGSGQIKTLNSTSTPIPAGKTWTCSVLYNSPTGGQTIVGGSYATLQLDNTSGTQTASGNISTTGNLNINNGGSPTFLMNGFNLSLNTLNLTPTGAILDMGIGTLTSTNIAAMDGTTRFAGASNGLAFPSGTVEYNGTSSQNVASGTYFDLLFSGIGGSYTIASDLVIDNTLTVTNGAVDVQSLVTLYVADVVNVTAPGTLTFEDNASLSQTGYTGSNVGDISVKRNTTPILLNDFTYWSSPTTGTQTLFNFSPNTSSDKFYEYSNNNWVNVNGSTTNFAPGIGYAMLSPQTLSYTVPAVCSFQFTGVPNNGTIAVPVTVRTAGIDMGKGEGFTGNPYPSALDANAFIDANITGTGTINQTITGTLYFWTHNHGLTGNDYDGNDYATYTKLGGAAVMTGTGNTTAPTQFIASGQGFFVGAIADGNITFDNSMRINSNNSNFYRTVNPKKSKNTATEETNRIWLNMTNDQNFVQALVGYTTNATNNYDAGYDGKSWGGIFDLYSINGTDILTIQAKSLPFVDTDIVPLGYSVKTVGSLTISIDHVDGLFLDGQLVFLEDKLLNVIHDITAAPYSFSSDAGTFNDRFVLRYTNKTLGTNNFETVTNKVLVSNTSKQIKINSFAETIDKVTIYDLLGRQIYQKSNVNSNELSISNLVPGHQTLVVKTSLQNGKIVADKIIY